MARRAQPINVLKLKGKKHLTQAEINARLEAEQSITFGTDKIRAPKWLNAVAKKEFKRLAKELTTAKLITNADVNALAFYCDAYAQYIECVKEISVTGLTVTGTMGTDIANPLLTKKKQLFDQMAKVAGEFGFTPCARAKIAIPAKKQKAKTAFENDFGDL